jgi:hypothetical protein
MGSQLKGIKREWVKREDRVNAELQTGNSEREDRVNAELQTWDSKRGT